MMQAPNGTSLEIPIPVLLNVTFISRIVFINLSGALKVEPRAGIHSNISGVLQLQFPFTLFSLAVC